MPQETRLTEESLLQFTGTEHWYKHGLARDIFYTDGARHVAKQGGAYWLLDEIAFAQRTGPELAAHPFQVWTLKVADDDSATLTCEDGNGGRLYRKRIEYSDFPLREITLWYTDNVILLPSEY